MKFKIGDKIWEGLKKNSTYIPIIYMLLGILWIWVTDQYIDRLVSENVNGQTIKGIFYVSLTGVLLYVLIKRYNKKIEQTQQKLRNLETQFLQAEKMESIGILFGKFIHDLRNKVMIIQGNVDLLRTKYPNCKVCIDLHEISLETKEFLNSYLQYSRKVPFTEELLDLSMVVSNHIKMMAPLLLEHNIEVSMEIDPTFPDLVISKNHFLHILTNLVLNARDAIIEKRKQGIPFGSLPRVIVGIRNPIMKRTQDKTEPRKQTQWELYVEDNGIGMNDAIQANLFKPFYTTKSHGTGLGLSAVKTLVDQLQSTIIVDSKPLHGTKFTIQFPLKKKN